MMGNRSVVQSLALVMAVLLAEAAQAQASDTRPATVDDLDCKALDFSLANADLITPGKIDTARILKAFTPDMIQRMQRSSKVDPNGLCHYRDINRALPRPTRRRVIFFGDSITEQWKMGAPELFTGDVIDRGISGQNTTQMLLRFRQDVLDLHPRVVHIMGGINDINTPVGTSLTQANIESMVDLAKAHGIVVILGAITPSSRFWLFPEVKPAPRIAALNAWLKDYARSKGMIYVDYHTPLADGEQGLRADLGDEGLHPNRLGYAVMTPLAKAAIARALDERPSH
jgi:lysophospholipase L1-like esterase